MASFDVAKLLNKITQDIPGINTVLKALAKWDVSALTDVPDGAMQATTDTNNRLTIKKKVSGSYTPVAKLMHDVDTVDGYHASASATPNTVAVRNASGALPGNILGNAATANTANTASALAAGAVVPVNRGGTGATTASQARTNLGAANGADFTTHIAKQASYSVEGHVKLDALAADGSNTAAPGGFGLGRGLPASTDANLCVANGWYFFTPSTANLPPATANYVVLVRGMNTLNCIQYAQSLNGLFEYTRTQGSGVWGDWTLQPVGITNSTSTVSPTIAASATAVKAVNDSLGEVRVQGSATWSADGAPYPIRAQVYHNSKQWLALRPNSVEPTEGEDWTEFSAEKAEKYDVGEFYYFRHPTIKTGFAPLQGGLIGGAYQGKSITEYPIWEYLQTADGQLLLKTEAEWQAMTHAIWHTNADGTQVGWNGIGGAPYFVQDLGAGTLRLPDVRGMYAEAAGFDSLGVGGVHGDAGRELSGKFVTGRTSYAGPIICDGVFTGSVVQGGSWDSLLAYGYFQYKLATSRVSPIANQFQPRAYGVLACVYLGCPK